MKKVILILNICLIASVAMAQDSTKTSPVSKGTWLIESNTGFGNIQPANTGMSLRISNGSALWNIGGEGGYFIADRLALKLGFGIGNFATGATSTGGGESGSGAGEAGEGGSGAGEAGEGGSGNAATPGTGGTAIQGLGTILSYKIGAKYYLLDRVPLQVDFSGTNVSGYNYELGFQGGYAFFLGDKKNISIEPGLRYSFPVTQKVGTIDNMFQMNVGFALLF